MGALADAVTGVFDAVGLKSWADSTFKGGTIIAVETSVSRMYKPSLLIDPIKQVILQSSLSKRSISGDIKQLIVQNNTTAIKKAWDYGLGVYNSAEIQTYYEQVEISNIYFTEEVTQFNAQVQSLLDDTKYYAKVAKVDSEDVKKAKFASLVAINLSKKEAEQQLFIAAYPKCVAPTSPPAGATQAEIDAYNAAYADYTSCVAARDAAIEDNWNLLLSEHELYKAELRVTLELMSEEGYSILVNAVASIEAQLAGYAEPEYQAVYRPDTYYYGIPLLVTNLSYDISSNFVAFPIIAIKELGTYIDSNKTSNKYLSSIKLAKELGYDLDAVIASVKEQDTDGSVKTVGIIQGVDLKSTSESAKEYVFTLFDTIGPISTTLIDDPIAVENPYDNEGTLLYPCLETVLECYADSCSGICTKIDYPKIPDPHYIKTEEGYLNIIIKFNSIEQSTVSSTLPANKYSITKVINNPCTNMFGIDNCNNEPNRDFSLLVSRGIGNGLANQYRVNNFMAMSYIDEGNGIEMDLQELSDMNFTDDSVPYLIPLFKGVYDKLKPMTKHALVRECGHIVVFSGVHKNLTWAETNAGFLQFVLIVVAIITLNPYLTELGFAIQGYAAFWTVMELAIIAATTLVGMLVLKAIVQSLFPNDVFAQIIVAVVAMYVLGQIQMPTSFTDPMLADKLLQNISAITNVGSELVVDINEVKAREYVSDIEELEKIYKSNKEKISGLLDINPLDDLIVDTLAYNRFTAMKPIEALDVFYARTLNQNPGATIGLDLTSKLITNLDYRLMV